jgi:hypothetical protein
MIETERERMPRTAARALTAGVQARVGASRIREELAIAAGIFTELPEQQLSSALLEGQTRDELLVHYRTAILLLDGVVQQLSADTT